MKSSTNIVSFLLTLMKMLYMHLLINLRIARAGKAQTIGEDIVLPSIKDTVGSMFGEKEVKEIERIPQSNNTVARRIDKMAEWTENELIPRIIHSISFVLKAGVYVYVREDVFSSPWQS